jgi:3-oxoacyl-[acyl-carrier protein] reductase
LVIQKYRGVPISMVFISSAGALTGDVGSMIYSSAKHALNGLAKGIAIEYGRFQITANVVSLGVLSLGMKNSVPEKRLKEMIQKTSTRTHVKVENVLSTIRFVLSNSDINGAVIPCDGGYFT